MNDNKKPLAGCVICADCQNCIDPIPFDPYTVRSLINLNLCGCKIDGKNYGKFASRPIGSCKYIQDKTGILK